MVAWVEEFSHRKYARPFLAVYKMEATKAVWVRDYEGAGEDGGEKGAYGAIATSHVSTQTLK